MYKSALALSQPDGTLAFILKSGSSQIERSAVVNSQKIGLLTRSGLKVYCPQQNRLFELGNIVKGLL